MPRRTAWIVSLHMAHLDTMPLEIIKDMFWNCVERKSSRLRFWASLVEKWRTQDNRREMLFSIPPLANYKSSWLYRMDWPKVNPFFNGLCTKPFNRGLNEIANRIDRLLILKPWFVETHSFSWFEPNWGLRLRASATDEGCNFGLLADFLRVWNR